MKLLPLAMILVSAIFCSTIRSKIDPTPTPLPLLGDTPVPVRTPSSPSPTASPAQPLKGGPTTISGGVLNGKAKSLPTPAYPPAARAVRASGSVSVQILVDETGKVVTASAVSGHPLLRSAAEQAAWQTNFEPTLLSGRPVKVSGVLTIKFVP